MTAQPTPIADISTAVTQPAVRSTELLARAYDFPCTLVLEVPVVNFTVGTLMSLQTGYVITTAAQHNEDIALKVNGQVVGMVEFDVVGERLAVRLTGVV